MTKERTPEEKRAAQLHRMAIDGIAGRIEVVQGPLGAGKTTFAARMCRKVAKNYGLQLVSNAELGPEWAHCGSWAELAEYREAVVLLDEIHLTLPANSSLVSKSVIQEASAALTFVRKRRQMIVATTQRWGSVSPIYRELMTRYVRVKPWWRGRLHAAYFIEPEDLRRDTHNQRRVLLSLYDPRKSRIETLAEVTPWWETPAPKEAPVRRIAVVPPPFRGVS